MAAYKLQQAGFKVCIYEAGQRPGGTLHTLRQGEWMVENGPNTVRYTPDMEQLVAELGLQDRVQFPEPEARNRYILKKGKLHKLPTSATGLLTTGLFGLGTKFGILLESLSTDKDPDRIESFSELIHERFGEEVADYLADPFVAGIFAGNPEDLSARYAFPDLWKRFVEHGSIIKAQKAAAKARKAAGKPAMAPIFSFPEGLQELADALANALNGCLRYGHTVTSINPTHQDPRITSWVLSFKEDIEESEHHDVLINTLPVPQMLPLYKGELHHELKPLEKIPHPPLAMWHLGFRKKDVQHPLDGFGMLVPKVEELSVLGAIFPSTIFPGRAPDDHVLITVFVGGDRQPRLARALKEEQQQLIQRDLQTILGVREAAVWWHNQVWQQAIPQYNLQHGKRIALLRKLEEAYPTHCWAGNYWGGIGVPSRVHTAFTLARELTQEGVLQHPTPEAEAK